MTDVLHLQCRSYPLHYRGVSQSPRPILVPGRGQLRPAIKPLRSLTYNSETYIEIDLSEVVVPHVAVPGIEIVTCRARVLAAGALMVIYAMRHDVDLRALSLLDLDVLDASVNTALRRADAPILEEVLVATLQAQLVSDVTRRPDVVAGRGRLPIDGRAVRYNCHFITRDPPWVPDERIASVVTGNGCRILLPYTYSWDAEADLSFDEALTMTESVDITVAQSALLVGATSGGRRILHDLARADRDFVDVVAFRRFLDGAWADYHSLDTYRIESAQHHRANFLAAHHVLDLETARQRSEQFLGYVATSLLSESSLRSGELDRRLNRVAGALTVVAAASFLLDAATFLIVEPGVAARVSIVTVVLAITVAFLAAVLVGRNFRRGARDRSELS